MIKKILSFSLLAAITAPLSASSISVNFTNGESDQQLASSAKAGASLLANWNNVSGATGSTTTLVDHTGAASGATLEWKAPAVWIDENARADVERGVANAQLLFGYLDDLVDQGPSFSVSNITAPNYTLILYFATDAEGATYNPATVNGKKYSVSGTKQRYQSSHQFDSSNSLTIPNLSGPLTVTMPPRAYQNRSCIAGFQILDSKQVIISAPQKPVAVIINVGGISLGIQKDEK